MLLQGTAPHIQLPGATRCTPVTPYHTVRSLLEPPLETLWCGVDVQHLWLTLAGPVREHLADLGLLARFPRILLRLLVSTSWGAGRGRGGGAQYREE